MLPRTLIAALAVALLALLAVHGSTAYYGPTAPEIRVENRHILVQRASDPVYNPAAPNTVVYGTVGNLVVATVPQSLAIEMHLDFLDRYSIRLADVGQDSTSTVSRTAPPNATLQGEYWFNEWGYVTSDPATTATCPTLDPLSPQEYKAATGRDWPVPGQNGQGQMPGTLQTEVSKHSVKGFLKQTNFLWRWDSTDDPNPLTHPDPRQPDMKADDEWRYGGPKNAGWGLTGAGFVDYYCRTDSQGNLFHNSWVEPLVHETGDPTGAQP